MKKILISSLIGFIIFAFLPINIYIKIIPCAASLVGIIYSLMNIYRVVDKEDYPEENKSE